MKYIDKKDFDRYEFTEAITANALTLSNGKTEVSEMHYTNGVYISSYERDEDLDKFLEDVCELCNEIKTFGSYTDYIFYETETEDEYTVSVEVIR